MRAGRLSNDVLAIAGTDRARGRGAERPHPLTQSLIRKGLERNPRGPAMRAARLMVGQRHALRREGMANCAELFRRENLAERLF